MQSKNTLQQMGLKYTDISLDSYPYLRDYVKTRTGKSTVPQIFFNKRYVGGNRELQDIISSPDQEKWNSLLQEVVLYIVHAATLLGIYITWKMQISCSIIIKFFKVRENDPPPEQDTDSPLLPHPSEALDDTMGKTSTYVKNKQVQTSYKMTRIA